MHRLERDQTVPRPRREVFDFFADAQNLAVLTPPFLAFRILTPGPIAMREGALIEYRIGLHGIPMRWRTRIDEWQDGERFVDRQLSGPYKVWRHLHTFEDAPEGTRMRDVVDYELPLGPLGEIARALFVRRQLETIFDFRRDTITRLFSPR